MKISPMNTDQIEPQSNSLSREQIESLLALGGWEVITGSGWLGLKRRGANGVVYRSTFGGMAKYAPNYIHEPDNERNKNLSWHPLSYLNLADLAILADEVEREFTL